MFEMTRRPINFTMFYLAQTFAGLFIRFVVGLPGGFSWAADGQARRHPTQTATAAAGSRSGARRQVGRSFTGVASETVANPTLPANYDFVSG